MPPVTAPLVVTERLRAVWRLCPIRAKIALPAMSAVPVTAPVAIVTSDWLPSVRTLIPRSATIWLPTVLMLTLAFGPLPVAWMPVPPLIVPAVCVKEARPLPIRALIAYPSAMMSADPV